MVADKADGERCWLGRSGCWGRCLVEIFDTRNRQLFCHSSVGGAADGLKEAVGAKCLVLSRPRVAKASGSEIKEITRVKYRRIIG